jgi:GNAT superfamily N-acetyltransferase
VAALLRGLSERSRTQRFLSGGSGLDERTLGFLDDLGGPRHAALVAEDGDGIIGAVECVVLPAGDVAEVAFEVADRHQGRGLAPVLLHHAVAMARARGIRGLVASAAADNHRMLATFLESGFPVESSTHAGVVELVLDIAEPVPDPARVPATRLRPPSVPGVVRALTVVGSGVTALAVAVAVSAGATVRAVVEGDPPPVAAAGVIAAFVAYAAVVVPWTRRWGTVPAEAGSRLPGDEAVPRAGLQMTRAVTIDAPPMAVWAWLAQIGADRGGFYSYSWLENLAGCRLRNAERIHDEWRYTEVGQLVLLHPMNGLPITRLDAPWSFAMGGWYFVLEARPFGRTRLIARTRVPRGRASVAYAIFVELPHFVMERKMLLGIRRRAEQLG